MTGRMAYFATLKLWDVTTGEQNASLLFESEPIVVAPLSELRHYWPELVRKAFKKARIPPSASDRVEGVNVASLRVSLSRGNGAGIVRRRFSWKHREYMVTLNVERESMVNVLAKLQTMALAPGRRPIEITFWQTGGGDFASIEFDSSVGLHNFPEEFDAAHPVSGEECVARVADMKEPKEGRTAILYEVSEV